MTIPGNLDELVDSLARRAAAAQRLLDSLTPEQRAELAGLMDQALRDAGLAEEMGRLQSSLRAARPDLGWGGGERMTGDQPMGYADATGALAELADLDELTELSSQDYPGASLADIDEEMVERALGRSAADQLAALRRIERELSDQGYLQRTSKGLQLTPRAMRRLGATALRRVFAQLDSRGRAATMFATREPRARSPARAANGSSATSSRSTSSAPCATPCCGPRPTFGTTVGSMFEPKTSRSSRPSVAAARRWRCWSTCRTRWSCAARGARRRRRPWHYTRWSRQNIRRTLSRSSGSATMPA